MNAPVRTITGRAPGGDIVTANLSEPFASSNGPEWIATIHCPALFKADRPVAGVDAAQALELAEMLVTTLFDHHEIELI